MASANGVQSPTFGCLKSRFSKTFQLNFFFLSSKTYHSVSAMKKILLVIEHAFDLFYAFVGNKTFFSPAFAIRKVDKNSDDANLEML